jgi:Xaa-Pro aminopeptidase
MHHSSEKLEQIRGLMEQRNIDAYLIPDTDPHIGEYIPDHWEIIKWVTGFTGSSATVLITGESALLWTDSRYFIQADRQLSGSGFDVMKPDIEGKNDITNWLVDNLETGSTIGFDGRLISIARFRTFRHSLKDKNITFDTDCDLINQLWIDRPSLPSGQAFAHALAFAGKERHQKLYEVRSEMKNRKAGFLLVTSPDEIMWLLNIRGRDIEYSPLLLSFAIIGMEQVLLFTFEEKIPYRLAKELDDEGIIILPYEETAGILSTLRSSGGIIISPESTSVSLYSAVPGRLKIKEEISILAMMKAVKNKTELANLEKTMVRDGVALTKFFYSIFHNRKDEMTEMSLTQHIDKIRSGMENNIGVSFPTIVAYNEHAALPHYRAG